MLLCAATRLLARDGVAPLLDSLLTAWQQLHPRIYPAYAAADSAAPPAAVAAALASLLGLWSAAYARRPRPVWFWTASLLLSLLLLTFSPTASPWQLVLGALVLLYIICAAPLTTGLEEQEPGGPRPAPDPAEQTLPPCGGSVPLPPRRR